MVEKNSNFDRTDFADENPRCFCADDDNCGCTFPQNMTSMKNAEQTAKAEEKATPKQERFIKKDTVCYCSPDDCSCTIDYQDTDY